MRIVHLITDLDIGGAERMLARLVSAIDRSEAEQLVVSMTDAGPLAAEIRAAQVEVRSLGLHRGQVALWPIWILRRWLHEWHADILHTWMYHADLLGTLATVGRAAPRLVWNLRASRIDMQHYRRVSGLTRSMCAWLSGRPALVIANSDAGVRSHRDLGYDPRAWRILPNGIDARAFVPDSRRRDEMRRGLGIPLDALVVGVLARYDPMKGHDVFARCLQQWLRDHPDAHVIVAGAGVTWDAPPYAELAAAVPAVVPRIHLLGARDDAASLWNTCDVACSPSRAEGFSNAIAEAMACGLPVVATDVGASAHIVGNPTQTVAPGDPAALRAGIDRVVSLPARERQALGLSARIRVVTLFSIDRVAAEYLETFRALLR